MKCKIVNLSIMELKFSRIAPPRLEIKYALVDEEGNSYGQGTRNVNFSPESLAKLTEALQALEEDVRKDLFQIEGEATTPSGAEKGASTVDDVPGF